jgi:hypothetical protein
VASPENTIRAALLWIYLSIVLPMHTHSSRKLEVCRRGDLHGLINLPLMHYAGILPVLTPLARYEFKA